MNKFKKILQDKVVQIVLLLCFVLFTTAAVATVYKNKSAKDENAIQKEIAEKDASIREELAVQDNASDTTSAFQEVGEAALAEDSLKESSGTEAANATVANAVMPVLNFSDTAKMIWPIEGTILMEYSMDTTVYHPTLKQYKVSPAVLIQGEAGVGVKAPANAKITEIGYNEEIGNYMNMDLGNGYQATLGNLKEITVIQGQYVETGNLLGVISEPTSYYSVEGSNLYFQLRNGEQSIDPLNYLQ